MAGMLEFALQAAQEAGAVALRYFQTGTSVETKADRSPVTAADRDAESVLRSVIAASYPDHGILGEEFGESGPQDRRWVIDPIDGTKSFICGVPLWATLLSFEENGRPIVAACVFPALGLYLAAQEGLGAFHTSGRCTVSPCLTLDEATICHGSAVSMRDRGKLEGLLRLGERALATRTWCDAYGHALVALGRVEAMLDPAVNHYDISAMDLIVREAGGRFTDFSGVPGLHREAVSSNGELHDEIIGAFQR